MPTIPPTERIRALRERQAQLDQHLQRCQTVAEKSDTPNPSAGRELDDTCAVLAQVHAELASLHSQ